MSSSTDPTRKLQLQYGAQIEAVLDKEPDLELAMDELGRSAERVGLVDSRTLLRQDSVWEFVSDLWSENAMVSHMMNLRQNHLPGPVRVEDLSQVIDLLGAVGPEPVADR